MKRKAPGKQLNDLDRAGGILIVNRWLKALAAILGTDAAFVVLNEGKIARIVGRYEIPHAFLAMDNVVAKAPYGADETVVLRDASGRPDIHAFLCSAARAKTEFFYRRPLSNKNGRVTSLIALGQSPLPNLGERELAIATEIGDSISDELDRYFPATVPNLAGSMAMTMADVENWLAQTDLPALVIDSGMVIRAANARMRGILKVDWEKVLGRPMADLSFPGRGGLEFLFTHALQSGLSTPRMDLAFEEATAPDLSLSFRLVGSPLDLVDGQRILVATLDPASVQTSPLRALSPQERSGQQATTEFLLETLVRRRALRTRKQVSYVTLRSWRQTIRDHQIVALRAIKNDDPRLLAAEIAAEMHDEIKSLFGVSSFQAVVPMPCAHSTPGNCLSEEIGKALARDLRLPFAHALSLPPDKGSSHPLRNVSRPTMALTTAVKGPVLLIDDVSTSGRHIEEASLLLREGGASVLAIAWIGGDAAEEVAAPAKAPVKTAALPYID